MEFHPPLEQGYDSDDSLIADIIKSIFTEEGQEQEVSTSDMDIDTSVESNIVKRKQKC